MSIDTDSVVPWLALLGTYIGLAAERGWIFKRADLKFIEETERLQSLWSAWLQAEKQLNQPGPPQWARSTELLSDFAVHLQLKRCQYRAKRLSSKRWIVENAFAALVITASTFIYFAVLLSQNRTGMDQAVAWFGVLSNVYFSFRLYVRIRESFRWYQADRSVLERLCSVLDSETGANASIEEIEKSLHAADATETTRKIPVPSPRSGVNSDIQEKSTAPEE